jgi:4-amino-4-deoxy-L-arabinose transferase-like glycosyltransferase
MKLPQTLRSTLAAVTGVALIARLLALLWNDRLFGDVNLYALVARQWTQSSRLDYPLKFDYFDPAPYLALTSPVSQHPPAWSWLAGLLTRYGGLPDAFAALQLLSLLGGLAVVVLGTLIARRIAGDRCAFWTGLLLALHPLLVDFSANGSPYIAVAAGTLAVALAVVSPDRPAWTRALLAATGAAAAWNFHGVGLLLIPAGFIALALAPSRDRRLPLLATYILATALLVAPLIAWNLQQFGKPVHSTSTFYILGKLGLVSLANDSAGIHHLTTAPGWTHVFPYVALALKSSLLFLLHLSLETGFAGLAFAALGTFVFLRSGDRRTAFALLVITLALALPCLGWPEFKYRFLVLLLPLVLIAAAIGFRRSRLTSFLATGSIAGCLIFWCVQIILTGSPAKYYAYDREHLADYRLMRDAATFLRAQPPGAVLSLPHQLDGGVEAVWWHQHPAILARGFPPAVTRRLIADFRPAYLLLSADQAPQLPALSPHSRLLFANPAYHLYALPPPPPDSTNSP